MSIHRVGRFSSPPFPGSLSHCTTMKMLRLSRRIQSRVAGAPFPGGFSRSPRSVARRLQYSRFVGLLPFPFLSVGPVMATFSVLLVNLAKNGQIVLFLPVFFLSRFPIILAVSHVVFFLDIEHLCPSRSFLEAWSVKPLSAVVFSRPVNGTLPRRCTPPGL